ncbi:S-adenosyl-L-methionine-dependent methyltransferase [Triangularia verruculosa]|uniref:tRNA (guanine(26)-N(2))-dimethyltransferase n=1 Tax=Triangularia verruculosa TaxID=2587418 RepID=A0AAN6XAZ2_9PEZI|nr:S-adenosyl-L-methionine-dependent methyltransferase [Triangularia verruculosa]
MRLGLPSVPYLSIAANLSRLRPPGRLFRITASYQAKRPLSFLRTMSDDELPGLDATPANGQRIKHDNVIYTTVKEGLAHILVPEQKDAKEGQEVQQVFYNPIQQFNRDLTVLAMNAYGKEKMQQKQAASKARSGKFAEKKRKRKEQAQSERPAKSPKLGENASDEVITESAVAPTDSEMPDAKEAELAIPEQEKESEAPTNNNVEGTNEKKSPALEFTILDALSASGLRALRYAHEIPFLTTVTSNDLLKVATESIQRNAIHNGLADKINVSHDDALAHMYSVVVKELRKRSGRTGKAVVATDKYDVIDLDPYGSAAPFLDAAVQAIRDDGGLLCVTCTDSGVWASNGYPEKCYALYGGVPVKGWYSHEVGLRIILHSIETAAAKYGLAIEPLLSLSVDYYVRVFVRVTRSPAMVKFQGGKNMMVYSCGGGCGAWTTQLLMKNKPAPNKKGSGIFYKHGFTKAPTAPPLCDHCGSVTHLAGPMYAGRIHDPGFVQKVIDEANEASPEIYGTLARVKGMLYTALEEFLPSPQEAEAQKESGKAGKLVKKKVTEAELAAIDPYPFYFYPAQVAGLMNCQSPPEAHLKGALKGLGYRVTRSHCKAGSIKTDAPWSVIFHVFREWVRQKAPVKEANIKEGSLAWRLLRLGEKQGGTEAPKEDDPVSKIKEVIFDEELGREEVKQKLVRYQMNPKENWGPMSRATGK